MHTGPKLSSIDLNLLVTLDALLQESSVTKAAVRLGRSQSAVSHALDRLRSLFGDQLLRRDGYGMRATPRAEAMRRPLATVLNDIRTFVGELDGFDPATSERELVIATPDLFAPLLGPLVATLKSEAPKLRLALRPAVSGDALLSGAAHLELAVGRGAPPKGIDHERIGPFDWAVLARQRHPIRKRPSLEQWARWPHVQVETAATDKGPISRAASAVGVERHVSVRVPSFVAALAMVSQSDALFTTLRAPIHRVARLMHLRELECPLDLPDVTLTVATRAGCDASVLWLRDRVLAACSSTT